MIELLRALERKWRGDANDHRPSNEAMARWRCADELSAILRDHSGEARKADQSKEPASFTKALVRIALANKEASKEDLELIAMTALNWQDLSNPTPTEASGSRSIPSSEPDAAMWREAFMQWLDDTSGGAKTNDQEFDWIEQRARELAGKAAA